MKEVIQLGKHRLMCGDSNNLDDILELLGGAVPQLVFTDPPYNIDLAGAGTNPLSMRLKRKRAEIEYMTNFNPQSFLRNLKSIFPQETMNAYIYCNRTLLPDYLNFAVENNYSYNVLVWNKPCPTPINKAHWTDIEYLVFLRHKATWNPSIKGVDYKKVLRYGRTRPSKGNGFHPTIKPIEIAWNEIQISSDEDGIVLDPFGGSGTTLLACEMLNRRCYMMEINPDYCDVIVRRYKNMETNLFEGE